MSDRTPPAHLSAPSAAWYSAVVDAYELEPWQYRTLAVAAEAHDRMVQARDLVTAEGITVADRFGQHRAHPALAVERDSRTAYLRAVRELNLELDDPSQPPRPPRRGGRR